jgi:hypothetical protein
LRDNSQRHAPEQIRPEIPQDRPLLYNPAPILLTPEAGHPQAVSVPETPMLELLKDLWAFMRERKKFWMLPIIIVMLLLGALIVLSQGSAVAPFIYTLF